MTISSSTTKVSYSGNASTTVFAYTFKIFDDDDITVILRTNSTGGEVVQTKTTHYTVSGVGSASGGNITFGSAPASGITVVLTRETALTQTTDYTPNDPFPAASHEDALDKITLMVQDQKEEIGRSIKLSRSNTMTSTEFTTTPTNRANKILGFDGSGELTVTEGKVDTVTSSVSAVAPGGTPTASSTYTASSGDLALAFGLVTGNTGATGSTGPRGSDAGLSMTFSNSTSDADPGAGKIAFNNGTLGSVSVLFIDDVDDNSVNISAFIQSFDDVTNAIARGTVLITKEGTPSTFAFFKVSGAVTDASGYTKVPVTHVISNGTFSNADGITLTFTYSGQDAGSTDVVNDTTPQLGGDLASNGNDIIFADNDKAIFGAGSDLQVYHSGSHSFIEDTGTGNLYLATNGTSVRITKGPQNTENMAAFNPDGSAVLYYDNAAKIATTATGVSITGTAVATTSIASITGSTTLDFAANQNFILTLTGSITLANPTTEQDRVGQSGFITFIQTGGYTVSLGTDYETAGGTGILLSASGTDIVPYIVAASGRILLGKPQLAFA